jgi:nitrogen-specific signal transduction histidine kinase
MKLIDWHWIKGLSGLLSTRRPEPTQQARRIVAAQLNVVLPAKVGVIAVVLHYLFFSGGVDDVITTRLVVLETLQKYFLVYVLCNAIATVTFLLWQRFPPEIFQWLVFTLGLLDGLFVAGLVLMTGGFESTAFWVFPGLIVLNALSIPLAVPQVVLNLLLSVFYLSAGLLDAQIGDELPLVTNPGHGISRTTTGTNAMASGPTNSFPATAFPASPRPRRPIHGWVDESPEMPGESIAPEPFLLHLFVLLLLAVCCYGVQVLAERQHRAREEEREFAVREAQLRTAGRLAAEIAHQLKNPLAIINNTVFSLQRASKEGKPAATDQTQIIQEEVGRADRILTDLMGYAQLAEGRVEKLDIVEELDRAVASVLPAAAGYRIKIERHYGPYFPPVLMQRRHLSEIFTNLLQNAREALPDGGRISITASCRSDYSIEVVIADDGAGIRPDQLELIFEAYYTTKEKGTGLGLATVKHNLELYGGTVRAESELGKGTRFILQLPAKAVISLKKPV